MHDLQPPGAGLPTVEREVLGWCLKAASTVSSDRQILKRFERETQQLIRLYEEDDSYDVFQEILIPRVIGIEDSSRNWSVAMVLDHLCKTNHEMHLAVTALSKGIVPRGEIDVALYKPDSEVGIDVIDRFVQVNRDYVFSINEFLGSGKKLLSQPTFPHPWFGPLNAHQWHQLTTAHQWIHRRQVQKIIAMLGVT